MHVPLDTCRLATHHAGMPRITRSPRHPLTEGALALRGYLDKRGQSVPAFCAEHAIDRITCQRAMNGDRKPGRISVDFATAIDRATRGKVPSRLWAVTAAEVA